jgi:mRNA interferase YafQ
MTIERSNAFKRDYRREWRTHGRGLNDVLEDVIVMLLMDGSLPAKYKNHKLSGDWDGLWECHIKPNLLLVYDIVHQDGDNDLLWLVRLGSYAELLRL